MCIALAMAFAHKSQCFQYKYISYNVSGSFDLQMCISNRLCLFFFQNNVFLNSLYLSFVTFYKVYGSTWPSNVHSKCYGILLTKSNTFKGIQIMQNMCFTIKTLLVLQICLRWLVLFQNMTGDFIVLISMFGNNLA